MVKRIISIGGEPAVGKTTIVKKVMKDFVLTPFKYGLVRGQYDKVRKVYFIGVFDDTTFEGTDKLSMAVQPDFIKLINYLDGGTIIFEGDRLFNNKLFNNDYPFTKLIITASKEVKDLRHKLRNDSQTETFLKSKKTKIQNIIDTNEDVVIMDNSLEDKQIIDFIKGQIC